MARSSSTKTPSKGYVQKPKSNVYTMLLILSFFAICAACVCMHAEMDEYDFDLQALETDLPVPPTELPEEESAKKTATPEEPAEEEAPEEPDKKAEPGAEPDKKAEPGLEPDKKAEPGLGPDKKAEPGLEPDKKAAPGLGPDKKAAPEPEVPL